MFRVLFNLLALVRTRHFCIHLQAMLSRGTLPVSLTRDYGHFLRKDPNTDFHPGLILLSAGVLSRKHFRLTVNDGVRRKASECMPLTTGKMNFYVLLTEVKALKRKMEKLHSKYVFAPADKAANNVIII